MFQLAGKIPLQLISDEEISSFPVKLYIKREDLLHKEISGNKWRKLKYNLIDAKNSGKKKIVTCGGAYSNHIAAVSAACNEYGFESIGIIRGEEYLLLNPTLALAKSKGMRLIYIPRKQYKEGVNENSLDKWIQDEGDYYFLPEGGTNQFAVKGTQEIVEDIEIDFDYVCSPVGTGGTLAGLISYPKKPSYKVLGFSSLKNSGFLEKEIFSLIDENNREWKINNEYHFGGYAKFDESLILFINKFYVNTGIELDPIYTGKMMFGIYDLIKKGYFAGGSTIVAIHTGGLQGKKGFNQRFGNILL